MASQENAPHLGDDAQIDARGVVCRISKTERIILHARPEIERVVLITDRAGQVIDKRITVRLIPAGTKNEAENASDAGENSATDGEGIPSTEDSEDQTTDTSEGDAAPREGEAFAFSLKGLGDGHLQGFALLSHIPAPSKTHAQRLYHVFDALAVQHGIDSKEIGKTFSPEREQKKKSFRVLPRQDAPPSDETEAESPVHRVTRDLLAQGYHVTDEGIHLYKPMTQQVVLPPIYSARPELHARRSIRHIPALVSPRDISDGKTPPTAGISRDEVDVTFTNLSGNKVTVTMDTFVNPFQKPNTVEESWLAQVAGEGVAPLPSSLHFEHVRRTIQQIGNTRMHLGDLPFSTVYNGVGLYYMDGRYVFLNPQGAAITHDGDLDGVTATLAAKNFTPPAYGWYSYRPETIKQDVRALLAYRRIVPTHQGIGLALLAALAASPFAQVSYVPPLLAVGITGARKTSSILAVLRAQQLYKGARSNAGIMWNGRTDSTAAGTTHYAMELGSKLMRGVVCLHDDVLQSNSSEKTVTRVHGMLSRLSQDFIGEKTGDRGGTNQTLGYSGTLTFSYIVSMETLHAHASTFDPSTFYRFVILPFDAPELGENVVDLDLLTWAQEEDTARMFNNAYHGFLQWAMRDDVMNEVASSPFIANTAHYIEHAGQGNPVQHMAKLEYALDVFLRYAVDIGAIEEAERQEVLVDTRESFQRIITEQERLIAHGMPDGTRTNDPVMLYYRLLVEMLEKHELYLSDIARVQLNYNEDAIDPGDRQPPAPKPPRTIPDDIDYEACGWYHDARANEVLHGSRELGALVDEGGDHWTVRIPAGRHNAVYAAVAEYGRKHNIALPSLNDLIRQMKRNNQLTTGHAAVWGGSPQCHFLDWKPALDLMRRNGDSDSADEGSTSQEDYEESEDFS